VSGLEQTLQTMRVNIYGMTKKRKIPLETARTTLASVKKEMEMPRLTESVRNDRGYQAALTAERPTRSMKSV
jgi:hypothetical protein